MNYGEALDYIDSFSRTGKPVKDLSRFNGLVSALGNPHLGQKFVHAAGTNGKGSVCEYIARGLRNAGFKTGKFTSPYINCIRERIQTDNAPISEKNFAHYVSAVRKAVKAADCSEYSQFEILTAAAFLYYRDIGCGFVVLETGIGGRLDCTNIVTPVLSVITSVDLDHCDILGSTAAEIASHKAGIIKKGIPVIVSPFQRPEAAAVLKSRAEETKSPFILPESGDIELIGTSLDGTEFTYKGKRFYTKMGGRHQAENGVTAIEALRALEIDDEHTEAALKTAFVPARMERAEGWIIDGAHNPSGAKAAADLFKAAEGSKLLLTGMLASKDWQSTLSVLAPCFDTVIAADFFSPSAVKKEAIADLVQKLGINCLCAESFAEAKDLAEKIGADIKAVCGSLYLCGAVRRELL